MIGCFRNVPYEIRTFGRDKTKDHRVCGDGGHEIVFTMIIMIIEYPLTQASRLLFESLLSYRFSHVHMQKKHLNRDTCAQRQHTNSLVGLQIILLMFISKFDLHLSLSLSLKTGYILFILLIRRCFVLGLNQHYLFACTFIWNHCRNESVL